MTMASIIIILLLFAILLQPSIRTQLTTGQVDFATKVAVCRAHCIDGFVHRFVNLTNTQCESDADCFMCWENCEMFYRSFDIWGPICDDPTVCFDGCQLACTVYKTKFSYKTDSWSYPEGNFPTVDRNVQSGYLKVEWPQPLPIYSVVPPLPHIVYVVFWKNTNGWIQINQTVSKFLLTRNSNMVTDDSLSLLILAATRDGIVGQLEYSAKTIDNRPLNNVTVARSYFYTTTEIPQISSNDNGLIFSVTVISVSLVSCVLLIVGTVFAYKIIKEQRRRYLLRRANALKLKRSGRSFNSPHGSRSNLVKIATISKPFNDSTVAKIDDDKQTHAFIKVDTNVPFVLSIKENSDGVDEIQISAAALKQKLNEQKSILV